MYHPRVHACVALSFLGVALFGWASSTNAATYEILHAFPKRQNDGALPYAGVTLDNAGNLYGTTQLGGSAGYGVVFKIAPDGREKVLHSFSGRPDGEYPDGGVTLDPTTGNLFGTTEEGGGTADCPTGCGVIYRLGPHGTETVLHNFDGEADGQQPVGNLYIDKFENLYGVASQAADEGYGALFRVKPNGKFAVLHAFTNEDGAYPASGPIGDAAGNLYGTTEAGGVYDGGVVYKVAPDGTESVLHSFSGTDGADPKGAPALDRKGNLYGTAHLEGSNGYGAVYKISRRGKFTILYNFQGGADGANPQGDLIEAGGNLYGTTTRGGVDDLGVVFEITKTGTERVLYSFVGGSGGFPYSGVTLGTRGVLYGTASGGGDGSQGVVFRLEK